MGETIVSKLIQKYEQDSGMYSSLSPHLDKLASIGEEFNVPNDISPEDLNKLTKCLGNLIKLMRKEKADTKNMKTVKDISSKISKIATRKVSQRTVEQNNYLLDLADILVDLKSHLGFLVVSNILVTFLKNCHNTLFINAYCDF